MRMLRLVPVFMLFLLVGGPVLLVAAPAYAWYMECCACGTTCNHLKCHYCPGESDTCPGCNAVPDSYSFQANAALTDGTTDIRGAREPLPSAVMKPNVTERLMELTTDGKRIYGNFALKLLGNAYGRKFTCPSSDQKNMGNTLLQFVRSYIQDE